MASGHSHEHNRYADHHDDHHDHSHGHHHNDHEVPSPPHTELFTEKERRHQVLKKLKTASLLCFTFLVVEVVGGILAGSLAVLSDAAHLAADRLSLPSWGLTLLACPRPTPIPSDSSEPSLSLLCFPW